MSGEPLLTVIGNLASEPEHRVSQAGKSWCTFRIASTPRVRDKQSGDWGDGTPLWFGCRAFGPLAENIVASLTKGTRVIVQGRLTQREYTDNQGAQRSSLDLDVEAIGPDLSFATAQVTKKNSSGAAQAVSQPAWGAPATNQAPQGGFGAQSAAQGDPWGNDPGGFDNYYGGNQ